ncbi:hypothetical protein P7C70_g4996, partial [Phenoliferia sp. Uapishka_3]
MGALCCRPEEVRVVQHKKTKELYALKYINKARISKQRAVNNEMGGVEGFKQHPWFRDYDWAKIESKEAIPPFEPDSKKANFDATHELEELLLEDNPLKAKKRNPNIDPAHLSNDYRLMEQRFVLIPNPSLLSLPLPDPLPPSSFLPYDFLRNGRKSWFVGDGTAQPVDPTSSGSTSTSMAKHPQAIGLEDQPLSDMASSRTGFVDPHRASSAMSMSLTPQNQSVELERGGDGGSGLNPQSALRQSIGNAQ